MHPLPTSPFTNEVSISSQDSSTAQSFLNMNPTASVYAVLNSAERQIRHIRLLPGTKSANVECELLVARLDNCEPFEALSYVWGQAGDTFPITVDGATMWVTKNLHQALYQLRYPDKQRLLWIDALCINQSSIPERN